MDNAINNNEDEIISEAAESPENNLDDVIRENNEENPEIQSESDETESGEETPPKKKLTEIIKEKFIAIGYEGTIVRLLIAWIMVSGYELISSEYKFNTFEFFNEIKMVIYVLFFALIFAVLTYLRDSRVDKFLLFFSSLIYGSFAVMEDNK
ncbi:MAG: hypothetical protein ACI4Q5_04925, partial [Porcipelethomonas sp.]